MFEKYKNIERKILIRRLLLALIGNVLIGAFISFYNRTVSERLVKSR